MSPNTESTSTGSEEMKGDGDDGVVANETLVISPVPSIAARISGEKGPGAECPIDSSGKDTGPPDGGYGWVVVMYITPWMEIMVVQFVY
jgi:hypothetical protein